MKPDEGATTSMRNSTNRIARAYGLAAAAGPLALSGIALAACSGAAFSAAESAVDSGSGVEHADSTAIYLPAGDSGREASAMDVAADAADGGLPGDATADGRLPADSAADGSASSETGAGFGDADAPFACAPPKYLSCPGTCVDPTTDPLNCGGCANRCPAPAANGVASCSARADGGASCDVACATGFHACHGNCLSDANPPVLDPCVLAERLGTFVSPSGNDTKGDGSRAHPYATITHGVDRAVGVTNRVYACGSAGSYAENLVIGTSPPRDGVHVFGGLDCSTTSGAWTYDASRVATVAPPAGSALFVAGLTTGVTFEDFAFQSASAPAAPPATGPGKSSIAVGISGAAGVSFTRVKIVAGNGQPGAAGTLVPYTFPPAGALQGNGGTLFAGGSARSFLCPAGDATIGGRGGDPPGGNPASADGQPGQPSLGGGAGSTATACAAALAATGNFFNGNGSTGAPGGRGAAGSRVSRAGRLSAAGWVPAGGADGTAGGAGQGGGGAGAFAGDAALGAPALGGGGGAPGGCGGAGGGGGGGGGGSVGVLAMNAAGLALNAVVLVVGNGGAGGPGAVGQGGQPGGTAYSTDCAGGWGGAGGNGGAAGGGAGGISVGVLYTSEALPPLLDATTLSSFQAGMSGPRGMGGDQPSGNDGAAGLSGLILPAP